MRRTGRADRWQPALRAGLLGVVLALAGCNAAVDAWRNVNGISQDDPNSATTPFAANLAAAEARPYPNLASVPPPPSREMSTAERDKLMQSLAADRAGVEHKNTELRAGNAVASGGPPPPPPPPAIPGFNPPAPPKPPKLAAIAPAPRQSPAAQPLTSSLKSPTIAGLPVPEQPQPALAPPRLAPSAAPAQQASPAVAALRPPPPPPPPTIEPRPLSPALAKSAAEIAPPPAGKPLVAIRFAAGVTALTAPERSALEHFASTWRGHPRSLRIVAYAATAGGAAGQLGSYHKALERAQAVAAALQHAGIPKSRMHTAASPAAAGSAGDRVVVLAAP